MQHSYLPITKSMAKYLILFGFLISVSFNSNGQGCTSLTHFPTDTLSVTNDWQILDSCSFAGEYSTFQVTEGVIYHFSTSQQDGSNIVYDSQLTLWQNGDSILAYNDDLSNNELQSSILWTADFTGVVELHLSEYDCSANTICGRVMYRTEGPIGIPTLSTKNVHIYPNPGNGKLAIQTEAPWTDARIFNAQGGLLAAYARSEIQSEIDISSYQQGQYLIELSGEKGKVIIPYIFM